jgi:5'-nucleotidase
MISLRRKWMALAGALLGVAMLAAGLGSVRGQAPPGWTLTILHTNDIHSRLQAVNRFDSTCSDREREQKQCFGGMARLAQKARELRDDVRRRGGHVLFLDAGDPFQGSLFYSHYKGRAELEVMNLAGYDAMAVGNHEFDDGAGPLAAFIKGAKFPVVSSNIDVHADKDLAGLLPSALVVERGGRKIGIIGMTTEDTPLTSKPPATVKFIQAEIAVKPIVEGFKRQGVDIIIALSHLGIARDREVAAAIDGIDIIVGGHSHTVLSNTIQNAAGPYPIVAKSPSGRNVPIVQAGAYSRYLGRIDLVFDREGNVVSWSGDTISLTQDIAEDAAIAAVIARLAVPLDEVRKRVIGSSAQEILQANCRKEECLVGNLVADAILEKTKNLGVQAVIQNGGGLRAAIGQGDVTMGAVLTVLPFQNTIATLSLKGADLVTALENGVSQVEQNSGRFPQVAGMRYLWAPTQPAGKRIVGVEMRAADGSFRPLDPNATYKIATNDFVRTGGDGYAVLREKAIDAYDYGPGLENTVAEYIAARSPVRVALEGRIRTR